MPKAAPLFSTYVRPITPGISGRKPVCASLETAQRLTVWSAAMIISMVNSFMSMINVLFFFK